MLLPKAPKAPKSLSVFEDFNAEFAVTIANRRPRPTIMQPSPDRNADPRVGAAFAFRSLDIEQLYVSFLLNAEDFFQGCSPTWTWQNLQSLALTSQLLKPTGFHLGTNALLCRAGVIALQMPKLRTLVLWNGSRGFAAAFIYQVHRDSVTITWRGTWNLQLTPQVIEAWQSVASRLHSAELRIEKQQIHDAIGCHGDAIHYLDLPCRVVEPASLWQIRQENAHHTT
jgi:hypothetical protein